jgi:hypothetical protein
MGLFKTKLTRQVTELKDKDSIIEKQQLDLKQI